MRGDPRGAAGSGSRSPGACGSSAGRRRRAPLIHRRGRPRTWPPLPGLRAPGPARCLRGSGRERPAAAGPRSGLSRRGHRGVGQGPAGTGLGPGRDSGPGEPRLRGWRRVCPSRRSPVPTLPNRCAGCHPAFPPRLPPPLECPWRHRGALISVYAVALSDSRSGNCLATTKFGKAGEVGKASRPAPAGLQHTPCESLPRALRSAIATSSAPLTSSEKTVRGLRLCWGADRKGCLQPTCTLSIFNFKKPSLLFVRIFVDVIFF